MRAHVVAALLFASSLTARTTFAQSRPAHFDTAGTLQLVGTPTAGERVPLVVMLPPTGTDAATVFAMLRASVGDRPFVVLLPAGAPTRAEYAHYGPFSDAFEARITRDIGEAERRYPVDPHRVVLVGFSLGGDLAWTFLTRHPDRYAGAFVMGSRCSSGLSREHLRALRDRHVRFYFAIGGADDAARRRGLRAAEQRLRAGGVSTHLAIFDGTHELPTDRAIVRAAFDALLAP